MKTIKILALTAVMLLATGCQSFINNFDLDPNRGTKAPINQVLTGAIVGMYQQYLGNMARNAHGYAQAHLGNSLQTLTELEGYQFFPSSTTNDWNSTYAGPLRDLKYVVDVATVDNGQLLAHNQFIGIAKTLQALMYAGLTDVFGDIPYSTALRDAALLTPSYDTQQSVYASLQVLLDEAITALNAAPVGGVLTPGNSDLLFGGNLTRWRRVAYILKARLALRLTLRQGATTAANNALAILTTAGLNGATLVNTDNLVGVFGTTDPNGNPWYLFSLQRGGQWSFGTDVANSPNVMRGLMTKLSDPRRLNFYNGNALGDWWNRPAAPLPIVTMWEAKFIEAEARAITGDEPGARAAAVQAVQLHFTYFNTTVGTSPARTVTDANNYLANALVDFNNFTGAALLQRIREEKFVSCFTQLEAFNEVRRTGVPARTPRTGANLVARFPYPQSEFDFNRANVPAVGSNIFTNVWWAQP